MKRRQPLVDREKPASPAVPVAPTVADAVDEACALHPAQSVPLIEVLHAVQERLGHIPDDAIRSIAQRLNLTRAEVFGVISFYSDFRGQAPGRTVVQICRAEACQAVGGRELERKANESLGVATGATRADGAVTLDAAYCLGNCALGPSVRINGRLHGRVSPIRLDQLLAAVVQ